MCLGDVGDVVDLGGVAGAAGVVELALVAVSGEDLLACFTPACGAALSPRHAESGRWYVQVVQWTRPSSNEAVMSLSHCGQTSFTS
jgi:hypothetical protein